MTIDLLVKLLDAHWALKRMDTLPNSFGLVLSNMLVIGSGKNGPLALIFEIFSNRVLFRKKLGKNHFFRKRRYRARKRHYRA